MPEWPATSFLNGRSELTVFGTLRARRVTVSQVMEMRLSKSLFTSMDQADRSVVNAQRLKMADVKPVMR